MDLCIFEDELTSNFMPLTLVHPCFNLRCGLFTLRERIERAFETYSPSHLCRPYLKPLMREQGLKILDPANLNSESARVLFVNGCLLDAYELHSRVSTSEEGDRLYLHESRVAAAVLSGERAQEAAYHLLEQRSQELVQQFSRSLEVIAVPALLATYPWDLVTSNPALIEKDLSMSQSVSQNLAGMRAILYKPQAIHVGEGTRIDAHAVLDAREGPIFLDRGVIVEPFSYIQGPTAIGVNTRIVGGQIRGGTSIGPTCRIGGEVEASIVQGYTNKYHAGFLGHSYLGEWVNIGAMTSNSDLKNTYGTVRVNIGNALVDTGCTKLGVFVADHVKMSIGTLLMGGTIVGVGCNILGGTAPKAMPPFVWGTDRAFSEYRIDKCIDVARDVMQRRGAQLSSAQENLIRHVFYLTAQQRRVVTG
jgi:UDP-N-acetylglucosamine diphosphorylase/glucosamine-1-phosphate N-acetyltransferase